MEVGQIAYRLFSSIPGWKGFLRLDEWLRIIYPIIWRTRLHYFVVFSFFLMNPLLLVWGYFYPIQLDSFRFLTQGRLSNLVFLFQLMGGLVIIYWTYKQYKTPAGQQPFGFYAKTWGLNTVCISLLYLNSVVFLPPLLNKIAELEEDQTFDNIYQYHDAHGFWLESETPIGDHSMADWERIARDLERYGMIEPGDSVGLKPEIRNIEANEPDSWLMVWSAPHYSIGSVLDPQPFKDRLTTIDEAKKWKSGKQSGFDVYIQWWMPLVFSIFLGSLVLLFSIPRAVFRRLFKFSLPSFFPSKLNFNYANLIKRFDKYLVTHYPAVWATKFHVYLIHAIVFSLVFLSIIWFSGEAIGNFLIDSLGVHTRDIEPVLWFLLMAVSSIYWTYFQIRNKYVPQKLLPNLGLIVIYFFLIFLVPLMFLTFLWVDEDTPPFLLVFAIPFVTGAYGSKFMSNRRSLYLVLLAFGVTLGELLLFAGGIFQIGTFLILLLYLVILAILYFFIRKKNTPLIHFFSILFMANGWLILLVVIQFSDVLQTGRDAPWLLFLLFTVIFPIFFTPAVWALLKTRWRPREV